MNPTRSGGTYFKTFGDLKAFLDERANKRLDGLREHGTHTEPEAQTNVTHFPVKVKEPVIDPRLPKHYHIDSSYSERCPNSTDASKATVCAGWRKPGFKFCPECQKLATEPAEKPRVQSFVAGKRPCPIDKCTGYIIPYLKSWPTLGKFMLMWRCQKCSTEMSAGECVAEPAPVYDVRADSLALAPTHDVYESLRQFCDNTTLCKGGNYNPLCVGPRCSEIRARLHAKHGVPQGTDAEQAGEVIREFMKLEEMT